MTEVIYMAVELDQDIMVLNMYVKFGENWTNTFQELDHTIFSGHFFKSKKGHNSSKT